MQPGDLKYNRDHVWVRNDDGVATIGITDHAQSELGDIVYVELPEVGKEVVKGNMVATVESVKTVSDIISPVSGRVRKVNESLVETPEIINEDPYGSGWLVSIEISNPTELEDLITEEEYKQFVHEN